MKERACRGIIIARITSTLAIYEFHHVSTLPHEAQRLKYAIGLFQDHKKMHITLGYPSQQLEKL